MILGIATSTYTLIHVVISLIGIGSGIAVLWGMIRNKRLDGITAIFLTFTVLTSVTGFGFPFTHVTPGIIVGVISLALLGLAIAARYAFRLAEAWRLIYVVTALMALYLNVFVLVVQSFEKVPALHALAPTQSEPPFVATQLVVLVVFIILTLFAGRKFHPAPASVA
ncbi:MAG TPA: hypothetical protein VMF10_07055 [Candidatus Aquilonibacter sp.]|nr:hypothetical protein [Candidatus Aquilonibacter sp.]